MTTKQYGAKIIGIGVSVPETVVKNDDITQLVETSDEWIFTRTGFKNRHVVTGNEKMTDLGVHAAKEALAFAGISGEEIDLIVMGSSTPDYIYPAGAGVIQNAIGAKNAIGFDVAMACSGLIYAIGIALQFIQNGSRKTALVLGSDTHSRYTDWYDRNTCVLFGDGAGAFIIQRTTPEENEILAMDMMLDGSRGEFIKLPTNRPNCPLVEPRNIEESATIYMNGREVFKFAVSEVPVFMAKTLAQANLTPRDVDYYVMHQANDRIMSAMAERMDIEPEQMIVSLENYGNTSAASIPLALNDALEAETIQPGQTIMMCGFGAGLAMAAVAAKWTCVDHRPKKSKPTSEAETLYQQ